MRGFILGASLSLVFIVGCVAGVAAKPLIIPEASAQQAASMEKWQYYCFRDFDTARITKTANAAGKKGWELVTAAAAGGPMVTHPTWCFKRAL